MWDGDPAVWAGRSPILFPIVGTLKDGSFRWDSKTYNLPRHGFARRSVFALVEKTDASATFRLESSEATLALWPFAFRLDLRYAIEGSTITLEATVSNPADTPMPASFGFHPAFRWPLPGGQPRESHAILFNRDEPAPVRRLDKDGLIDPATHKTPIKGRQLALDDALFVDDALILDQPRSDRLIYGAPGGGHIAVTWDGMPQIAFWTKPGAGYLCIEPWHGLSDPAGFEGTIDEKPGIVMIPGGESRRFTMTAELL
jgi:galactose mutarotase-like enzyme